MPETFTINDVPDSQLDSVLNALINDGLRITAKIRQDNGGWKITAEASDPSIGPVDPWPEPGRPRK